MSDFVLSCCSTADLTHDWLVRRDIAYVEFNYQLGGTWYKDDFGMSNPPERLYARMLAGEEAKTSQVGVGDYIEHFERYLSEGKDILHVTLSTGISGTYNSACAARDQLVDKYPDRKLVVIDSLAAASGYGLLMDKLADLRDSGMSLQQVAEWTEAHRLELNHWFFSSDLTFFIRGGRISKAAGLVGGMLKICPVMDVAVDGSLAVREKIRTKSKAMARVLGIMQERAEGGVNYSGKCFISHSDCEGDARELAGMIEAAFPKLDGRVQLFPIGATIGCHTGPGTVATFFWGAPRA